MIKLDKTDLAILRTLQGDSKLTTKELAQKINLSTTPTYERVRRLEHEGYIQKYIAVLDAKRLDFGFTVFCTVKLKQLNAQIANEFTTAITEIQEVMECYNVSGDFDYMLKIQVPNMKAYQHFVLNILGQIESVGSLQSIFVIDEIKRNFAYPI